MEGGYRYCDAVSFVHFAYAVVLLSSRLTVGAHCTGSKPFSVRQRAGLTRKSCVVVSVGSSFTLEKGIDPKDVAR